MIDPDCTDVCEIIIKELRRLGYKVSDEDHTDIIDKLSECHLERDSRGPFIILNWNGREDAAIMTEEDGSPRMFSSLREAEKAAKEECAFNYKVVGI